MKEIKMTRSMWKTLKAKEKMHYLWCGFMIVFMEVLSWIVTTTLITAVNALILAVPLGISLLVLRIFSLPYVQIALYSYSGIVLVSVIATIVRFWVFSKESKA